MVVINHTVRTVFTELIKVMGVFKHYRMKIVRNEINHVTWRGIQDLYLTVDNLVLEMASGMELDKKRGFKKMIKFYQENAIPDRYLYTTSLFVPDKERILNPKPTINRKRGRPRKK